MLKVKSIMDNFKITLSKSAAKAILKYDKPTRNRLFNALNLLPKGDVVRLQGKKIPPIFRLRVGGIRILFLKDEAKMEIFVFEIDSRGGIYK